MGNRKLPVILCACTGKGCTSCKQRGILIRSGRDSRSLTDDEYKQYKSNKD